MDKSARRKVIHKLKNSGVIDDALVRDKEELRANIEFVDDSYTILTRNIFDELNN